MFIKLVGYVFVQRTLQVSFRGARLLIVLRAGLLVILSVLGFVCAGMLLEVLQLVGGGGPNGVTSGFPVAPIEENV